MTDGSGDILQEAKEIFEDKKDTVIVSSVGVDLDESDNEKKNSGVSVVDLDREKTLIRIKELTKTNWEQDGSIEPVTLFLYDVVQDLTPERAIQILRDVYEEHYDDVNFPAEDLEYVRILSQGYEHFQGDVESYNLDVKIMAALIDSHSPYPEVRAVCDPFDDPTIPVETFRVYVLGIVWVGIGAFVNEFFQQRQPSLTISSTAIQLLLYPCGKIWAKIFPDWGFTFRGKRVSLNPGPWTNKEQMLATLMVNIGATSLNFAAYIMVMRLEIFFNLKWVTFGFMFVMNLSSLFFGFGLAGIMRRWVIYPVKTVWPTVLPTLALNRALLVPEAPSNIHGWTISRYKFFFVVLIASFLYFFVPDYLFKALSFFNWMTWIKPDNKSLAIITGSYGGLGFNPIATFDWSVINYSVPLTVPFFSIVNRYIGMMIAALVMIPLYWKNYKWTAYLPINSANLYDNLGKTYNTSRISSNLVLDEEAYKNYSPPYISIGNLMLNGSLFALYVLAFTYVLLTEHRLLWKAAKSFWYTLRHPGSTTMESFNDPHTRMMRKYSEVPDWWYIVVLVLSFVFGVIAVAHWPTDTPVWSIVVIVLLSIAMLLPSTLVYSITGYELNVYYFAVIITGYMCPGNGMANMLCRLYGNNIDVQGESFISDQKMGHYVKLPPRAVFRAQMVAVFIQCCITIGVTQFSMTSIKDFCSLTQVDKFTCAFPHQLYSQTIMYGIVGPQRMFFSLYPALKYCFLIGFLLALPAFALKIYFPKVMMYANPILLVNGFSRWGNTYNLTYYTPGLIAGYVFNRYIKSRYIRWWTKYNYVLTSALSAGIAFGGIIIFLTLQYTGTSVKWWGNTVYAAGLDYSKTATLLTPPPEGFGLKIGEFE
ncbi:OPT oligopeptide transporter protein-domain-containing protein [Kockiozyma suomiensis]|uniref:OPT oligopeptide transporter protein-domain-containing protein n=1 Tax=Kockiozyma suomiensis TaxID=1337062 RepID=UPI0033437375